jgi:ABC-2 type transport system ATP-binding protein
MNKKPAFCITELTKTYSNGVVALKGISLSIKQGDFFALLGPNGAGKSTTIGILCGLVQKTAGSVEICGYNIDTDSSEARKYVGVVPQEFNFGIFESVYDVVINQAGYYGISRKDAAPNVEKYLRALGLWEKRMMQSKTLSGGMKRRLMIARALVHNPKLLILDEPTAGVDIELRRGMWDFLRDLNQEGTTIILTTHYLEEAELLCTDMAIINKGMIVKQGPIKSLLASMEDESVTIDLDRRFESTEELSPYAPMIQNETVDITISREHTLDVALKSISKAGYIIKNIRPKSGRLEEFFIRNTQV